MQLFRGGLAFKAHRLGLSLNSRLESNKEEEEKYLPDVVDEVSGLVDRREERVDQIDHLSTFEIRSPSLLDHIPLYSPLYGGV